MRDHQILEIVHDILTCVAVERPSQPVRAMIGTFALLVLPCSSQWCYFCPSYPSDRVLLRPFCRPFCFFFSLCFPCPTPWFPRTPVMVICAHIAYTHNPDPLLSSPFILMAHTSDTSRKFLPGVAACRAVTPVPRTWHCACRTAFGRSCIFPLFFFLFVNLCVIFCANVPIMCVSVVHVHSSVERQHVFLLLIPASFADRLRQVYLPAETVSGSICPLPFTLF